MLAFISIFRLITAFSLADLSEMDTTNPAPGGSDVNEEHGTPYTEYGSFSEDDEEAENSLFFQYGRFFGVSIGAGYQGVTGNRGVLWQGGFPMVDLKVHYWFDFNFAIQLQFTTVSHNYDFLSAGTPVDVTMTHLGVDLKYYFDTRNLSAALTFVNPYILVGGGNYSKTERDINNETVTPDSVFGFNVGGALEFLVSHRKVYFTLEGKYHFVNFEDRLTSRFQPTLTDLSGNFYTVSGSVLFTW